MRIVEVYIHRLQISVPSCGWVFFLRIVLTLSWCTCPTNKLEIGSSFRAYHFFTTGTLAISMLLYSQNGWHLISTYYYLSFKMDAVYLGIWFRSYISRPSYHASVVSFFFAIQMHVHLGMRGIRNTSSLWRRNDDWGHGALVAWSLDLGT
jgi:hypothetical protein